MIILQIDTTNVMTELSIKDNDIFKYLHNKGLDDYECLYSWNFQNNTIKCYGLYSDNYSNINKHTLPPGGISNILNEDSSSIILSGNIYICAYKKDNLIDYYISDYGTFYYITNENNEFEDTQSDDDIDTSIDNNNIQKKEPIYNESIHNNNNILHYDTNIY